MSADKKTIGITKGNAGPLAKLLSQGYFGSELDAAKFAMAYAIKQGGDVGTTEGAETKWNVGSFDPDGSMRSLLEALFPDCVEPYRLAEYLMNEGIRRLTEEVGFNGDIYEMIFPTA